MVIIRDIVKRSPDIQKRRILDAACAAFARDGFEGARVDAIAAAAEINKRMLYHYFGDKQALFDAALEDSIERLRASLGQAPWQRDAPETRSWLMLAGLAGTGRPLREKLDERLIDWLGTSAAGDYGDRAVVAMALELLVCVVPELIDTQLGPFESSSHRYAAVAAVAQRICQPTVEQAPKPRFKLQPRIQPA